MIETIPEYCKKKKGGGQKKPKPKQNPTKTGS